MNGRMCNLLPSPFVRLRPGSGRTERGEGEMGGLPCPGWSGMGVRAVDSRLRGNDGKGAQDERRERGEGEMGGCLAQDGRGWG